MASQLTSHWDGACRSHLVGSAGCPPCRDRRRTDWPRSRGHAGFRASLLTAISRVPVVLCWYSVDTGWRVLLSACQQTRTPQCRTHSTQKSVTFWQPLLLLSLISTLSPLLYTNKVSEVKRAKCWLLHKSIIIAMDWLNKTPTWCNKMQILLLQTFSTCFGLQAPIIRSIKYWHGSHRYR